MVVDHILIQGVKKILKLNEEENLPTIWARKRYLSEVQGRQVWGKFVFFLHNRGTESRYFDSLSSFGAYILQYFCLLCFDD